MLRMRRGSGFIGRIVRPVRKFFKFGNLRENLANGPNGGDRLEPLVGFEPTTYSLRMNCSTPELQRRLADVPDKTKAHGDPQAGNPHEDEMGRNYSVKPVSGRVRNSSLIQMFR